jgi:hypothetical protein
MLPGGRLLLRGGQVPRHECLYSGPWAIGARCVGSGPEFASTQPVRFRAGAGWLHLHSNVTGRAVATLCTVLLPGGLWLNMLHLCSNVTGRAVAQHATAQGQAVDVLPGGAGLCGASAATGWGRVPAPSHKLRDTATGQVTLLGDRSIATGRNTP